MAPISLRALVGHIGLSIAIFTAVVIPVGYLAVGYANKAAVMDFQAELTAARVAKYIYSHNTLWQYQQVRIAELIDQIEMQAMPVRRRIVDQAGVPVIDEEDTLAQPTVTRIAPIMVSGVAVGELRIEASARALLLQTGLVALLSALLGFAMYLVLRVFPLRVLDRTLGQLHNANRVAQERSELLEKQYGLLQESKTALQDQNERFDAALNNMTQGLCMFDRDARLVVYNQRFLGMYGLSPNIIKPGCSLDDFVQTLKRNNSLSGNAEQYLRNMRETLANGKAVTMVVEIEDGRVLSLASQPMANGGWVSTHEDITERRRAEAKIVYMAHHDALTNLPNRVQFRTEMEKALGNIGRGENLAVLSLDLDRFKQVNDTLGHAAGDRLLQAASERLQHGIRDSELVARLGGDEFAILQSATDQPNGASSLATRLIESLSKPFNLDGQQVVIGASVGISIAPVDGFDVDELLKKADMGLYRAKAEGKGTFRFFEAGMDSRMQARRMLELDLRKAIANSEFELYFQPILKLDPQEIIGFEALLRWHHPERGIIQPNEFIPLAEEIGLIVPIGEWVLRQATLEACKWPKHLVIAINLSAAQFRSRNLVPTVVSALANSGIAPGRLELEITESVLLQDEEATLATLHKLRDFGVRIAMDDFGTGYSSLGYLRSFPFDKIKIDQSFIKEVSSRSDSLAIVRAVTGLGTSLGISTTAEGVESLEQLERLKLEGCNEGQGFLFSPPVPAKELPALIEKHGIAERKVA